MKTNNDYIKNSTIEYEQEDGDISVKHKSYDSYNLSVLKSRGWTTTKIKKELGEPDSYTPNPRYRYAAPQKLYDKERVHTAEDTQEFKDWLEKSTISREKRSKSMKEMYERKRLELIEYIGEIDINIPRMNLPELQEKSCKTL